MMGIAFTSDFYTGMAVVEPGPVTDFPDFTASCEDVQAAIVATLGARADLRRRLDQQTAGLRRRNPRMPLRQLTHMALIELITDLREEFPAQEFTLYTDLGDGAAAAIDTVASAENVRSRRLLAELLEPPALVAERKAVREAKSDFCVARAHGHIVETLLFGRDDADAG